VGQCLAGLDERAREGHMMFSGHCTVGQPHSRNLRLTHIVKYDIEGDPVTEVHENPQALPNILDRTLQQAIVLVNQLRVDKKQWEFHVTKVGQPPSCRHNVSDVTWSVAIRRLNRALFLYLRMCDSQVPSWMPGWLIGAQAHHQDRTYDSVKPHTTRLRVIIRQGYGEHDAGDFRVRDGRSGAEFRYPCRNGTVIFQLSEVSIKGGKIDHKNPEEHENWWSHSVSPNDGMDYRRSTVLDYFIANVPLAPIQRGEMLRRIATEYHLLLAELNWQAELFGGVDQALLDESHYFRPTWNGGHFVASNLRVRRTECQAQGPERERARASYQTYDEYQEEIQRGGRNSR
jgi:hypothetical protein